MKRTALVIALALSMVAAPASAGSYLFLSKKQAELVRKVNANGGTSLLVKVPLIPQLYRYERPSAAFDREVKKLLVQYRIKQAVLFVPRYARNLTIRKLGRESAWYALNSERINCSSKGEEFTFFSWGD